MHQNSKTRKSEKNCSSIVKTKIKLSSVGSFFMLPFKVMMISAFSFNHLNIYWFWIKLNHRWHHSAKYNNLIKTETCEIEKLIKRWTTTTIIRLVAFSPKLNYFYQLFWILEWKCKLKQKKKRKTKFTFLSSKPFFSV